MSPFARSALTLCTLVASLGVCHSSLAEPAEPGRLFYTPAQRAQLENLRARNGSQRSGQNQRGPSEAASAPVRFDGIVIRSDGTATRWVDGKPQLDGAAGVSGLKPGQIRADGRVYEPYQVLRPTPPGSAESTTKDPAP